MNETPTAVIQVKPGIGDVLWHLPFIRAIAAASPGGAVTFLAPPSSLARELLVAEPCVAETLYFQHGGSELRRGINLFRLIRLLRSRHFRRIWILDRTVRPALAALLAGIPERIGLGFGPQRLLISNGGIDRRYSRENPIDCLKILMFTQNFSLASTEPNLALPDQTFATINQRFGTLPRPWLVLGLGASHPSKDWPDRCWRDLLHRLHGESAGTVFMIGGGANSARAARLIAATSTATAVNACDLPIIETAALLRRAELYVGPDSGPMNLAAAVGTPAYGLFGRTQPLRYSRYIHVIRARGDRAETAMEAIAPEHVLASIRPQLAAASAASGSNGPPR